MIWKKTWFSYVLWALYSAVISLALASGLFIYVPSGNGPYVAVGVVCLFFLLIALVFFLLQLLLRKPGKIKLKKSVTVSLETGLLLAASGVFFVLQAQSISKVDAGALRETEYLVKSFVQDGMTVSKTVYGAEWFYLCMLRWLFLFVGNHAKAALWLQVVLQVTGSFFLYAGIRKLSGGISGVLGFTGLLLIPFYASERNILTPLWTEFFLFAVGFYGVACFLRRRRELDPTKERGKGAKCFDYLAPVFLGIYISCVIYGDLSGILLLFLGLSVLWSLPVRGTVNQEYPLRTIQALCLLGGCVAGLFLLFLSSSYSLKEWWSVYATQEGKGFPLNFNCRENLSVICLNGCLFWGIFRYFYEKKEDSLSGIFFFALGIAGLRAAGLMMPRSQEVWLLLLLTICASITLGRSLTRVRSVAENLTQDTGEKEKTEPEETETKAVQQEETEPKIKFLENPLPGPKKHVPKKLDYDIKISDDDDFDI